MKYNVGDKVQIKSLDWYNENKDEDGIVELSTHIFTPGMSQFCGKVMTIEDVFEDIDDNGVYYMEEIDYDWTDEMIEGYYEEENIDCEKCGLTRNSIRCLFMDNCPHNKQKNIIEIPEDYVIKDENGNVIDTHKIVLEKKKKEYPKLFVDCCAILYPNDNFQIVSQRVKGHKGDLLFHFQKLLICRDAYWMVYGEENKLGKPWEPDWESETELKYTIVIDANKVCEGQTIQVNTILAFPTEEMRDQFYNNFNIEIDICKNLL